MSRRLMVALSVVAVIGAACSSSSSKAPTPTTGAATATTSAATATTGAAGTSPTSSAATAQASGPTFPLLSTPAPTCTPDPNYTATGVTPTSVTIGNIITQAPNLPVEEDRNYYGLQAYVNLVNQMGGVCGRQLKIMESNDLANPATHDYKTLIHQVFAFVSDATFLDGIDYQQDAPFNPLYQDNGQYVPDVGGLALSNNHAQSPWYAGLLGSFSPSLSGWGAAMKFFVQDAASRGKACRVAGVGGVKDPSGVGDSQSHAAAADLAAAGWGGGLGSSNVHVYLNNLADPEPVYEQLVSQMISDGVNCVIALQDLTGTVNFLKAAVARGVWPPDKCTGSQCFSMIATGFGNYDPSFLSQAGDAANDVLVWEPTIPLNETSNPVLQVFLNAIKSVPKAVPATYTAIGFASGAMFVDALQSCGAAPTRDCVMNFLRNLQNFDAGGLIGPITPFQTTTVSCAAGCRDWTGKGTYQWKWTWTCNVTVQVQTRNGVQDFYRYSPSSGFLCGQDEVISGTST